MYIRYVYMFVCMRPFDVYNEVGIWSGNSFFEVILCLRSYSPAGILLRRALLF